MAIESSVIFFPVTDIQRTADFYVRVCGLRLHQSQGGGKSLIFDTGYGFIGFVEYGRFAIRHSPLQIRMRFAGMRRIS